MHEDTFPRAFIHSVHHAELRKQKGAADTEDDRNSYRYGNQPELLPNGEA